MRSWLPGVVGSAYNPWGQEEFKVSVSYLKPAQKQNCCCVWWRAPVIPVLGRLKNKSRSLRPAGATRDPDHSPTHKERRVGRKILVTFLKLLK